MNKYDIYNKAIKVIDSCETREQLSSAYNYIRLVLKVAEKQLCQASFSFLYLKFDTALEIKKTQIRLNF